MVKVNENIPQSINSVSKYNIDSNTFEAQLYLLLNEKMEKNSVSRNKQQDTIAASSEWDWDDGIAPTNWGFPFPPPPPPPGSWGNTIYPSAGSTQTSNALPTITVPLPPSSTYNISPTIDSSTLVISKPRTWHRTRHRTKQHNQASTIGPTPTAAPLNDDGSGPRPSNHRIGPIIGGVIGGVCGAAFLAILLCVLLKRSKTKKRLQDSGSVTSLDMYSYRPGYNNTPRTFVQPANTNYDLDYIYCSPDDRYVSPTENDSHRSWGGSSTVSNTAVYLPNNIGHHSELISPYDSVKPDAQ